jgi:dihydrofolate synthase/folylpolyglutamate synthase
MLDEIVARYSPRGRREGLDAVERLRVAAGIELPRTAIAVVGTNGKTSTSVYLARLLAGGGARVGLTTSPHVREWRERIRVDGEPIDADRLRAAVERLDALAADRTPLRFFDLLVLAAAQVFAEDGVDIGVFEAGIGGRSDATRVLRPRRVVLTGVALDHVDILGGTEREILREKLLIAPPGATIVVPPLDAPLAADAETIARGLDATLVVAELDEGAPPLERNLELARRALAAFGLPAGDAADLAVEGRYQRAVVDGVPVVVDAAHNPQAWRTLAASLRGPHVAVVSISRDRDAAELADALAAAPLEHVVATTAWERRSLPAAELAAALPGAVAVDDPRAAVAAGLVEAKRRGIGLAVFGSSFVLRHALDELGL